MYPTAWCKPCCDMWYERARMVIQRTCDLRGLSCRACGNTSNHRSLYLSATTGPSLVGPRVQLFVEALFSLRALFRAGSTCNCVHGLTFSAQTRPLGVVGLVRDWRTSARSDSGARTPAPAGVAGRDLGTWCETTKPPKLKLLEQRVALTSQIRY